MQYVRTPGAGFAFSVASVGVPLASDVGHVAYREHKRYPSQGNPSRFLSFVCQILEYVRAPGLAFVHAVASVGVPWACDVGGVQYRQRKRFREQGNLSRFLSCVCPILEEVRSSGVVFVLSVASVRVPWGSDVGCAGYREHKRFPA